MFKEERQTLPIHMLAGMVAGGATRLMVAPLDVLKIRFQVQVDKKVQKSERILAPHYYYRGIIDGIRQIVKSEGLIGLWRGNLLAECLWISYMGLQFMTFEICKRVYQSIWHSEQRLSSTATFVCGGVAGFTAQVISYPLDLLRTRFAAQSVPKVYKSIPHAIVTIAKDGGIRGFYSGLCASIVQVVPYAAIQFTTYHGICRFLGNYRKHPIGQLFAGASAGLIGKLAVLPLDVLKKRLQMWGLNEYRVAKHHTQSPKMRFVAKQIAKYEGLRAFYKGASPAVLKAALQAALAFTLYEQVRTGLTRLAPKRKH